MGAWKEKIKPMLIQLRGRRTGSDKLKEDYYKGKDSVFCKCGKQIIRAGQQLALFTQVELDMDDGNKHVTACCRECAPRLVGDSDFALDYYILDLVQWQAEGDLVDAVQQPATAARLSEFLEKSANRKPK
jgi:hypothetical protein